VGEVLGGVTAGTKAAVGFFLEFYSSHQGSHVQVPPSKPHKRWKSSKLRSMLGLPQDQKAKCILLTGENDILFFSESQENEILGLGFYKHRLVQRIV
jgi:hypothetical protein